MADNRPAPSFEKSRGAASNPASRYDRLVAEAVDDGWDLGEQEAAPRRTTVEVLAARNVLTKNDSPDIAFDRSINPFRGCEHGCVYCFARPSHGYLGLSSGLDFETRLFVKPDAARLLEKELRKPGYAPAVVAIGTNTDPYQPIERQLRVMRGCLEVLAAFNHPVAIVTKSHLVTRDLDLLGPMAAKGLASVSVSVTTLDRDLCRKLEPRAATPEMRLDAIRQLSAAGIPANVMVAPVIPFITDHEIEAILARARAAGAIGASYILLRLPYEVKDLFAEWLEAHFPAKARHVLSLVSQSRGGKLYDATYGTRFSGTGGHAELLAKRFTMAARRLGLAPRQVPLRVDLFAPPPKAGDQLALF